MKTCSATPPSPAPSRTSASERSARRRGLVIVLAALGALFALAPMSAYGNPGDGAAEDAVDATASDLFTVSAAEAATLQGIPTGALLRTIVVRRGEDDYLFVLVPAGRRFDWPKLRAHLGVRRMTLPDAEEARAATGWPNCPPGGQPSPGPRRHVGWNSSGCPGRARSLRRTPRW